MGIQIIIFLALYVACCIQNDSCLPPLPQSKAVVENEENIRELDNALREAAQYGEINDVKQLLARGANINSYNKEGWSALFNAVYFGHKDVVALLIERLLNESDLEARGAIFHHKDTSGFTVLEWAAYKELDEIISLIAPHAAEEECSAALMRAAKNGSAKILTLLVRGVSNVHKTDEHGWTAFDWAVSNGHHDCVKILASYMSSHDVSQALMVVVREGNDSLALLLLELGADIFFRDHVNRSVIQCALRATYPAAVMMVLLNNKAPFFASDIVPFIWRIKELARHGDNDKAAAKNSYELFLLLTQLCKVPVMPKVSYAWMSELEREALPSWLVHQVSFGTSIHHYENENLLTVAQQLLANVSFNMSYHTGLAQLTNEISLLTVCNEASACRGFASSYRGENFIAKPLIALCNNPDFELQLDTVFHEIGHIIYGDIKDYDIFEREHETESFIHRDLEEVAREIESYIQLGKTACDNSSVIGRYILTNIRMNQSLWDEPKDSSYYKKLKRLRAQEQRADLFSMTSLFSLSMVSALVSVIHRYAESTAITADNQSRHPSDLERALYYTGFLVAKGLDCNELFRRWDAHGTCKVFTYYPVTIKPNLGSFAQFLNKDISLLAAVKENDFVEVLKLLKEGANPDSIDSDGYSAILRACMNHNKALIKLLLRYHANVDVMSFTGMTPYSYAEQSGNNEMMNLVMSERNQ